MDKYYLVLLIFVVSGVWASCNDSDYPKDCGDFCCAPNTSCCGQGFLSGGCCNTTVAQCVVQLDNPSIQCCAEKGSSYCTTCGYTVCPSLLLPTSPICCDGKNSTACCPYNDCGIDCVSRFSCCASRDDNNNCCSGDATCCGETCCPSGTTCCGSKCCASGQSCCGDICCDEGYKCCGDDLCCPITVSCCGTACCIDCDGVTCEGDEICEYNICTVPSSSYEYYPVTLPEPQYESYVTGGILAILIVGAVAIGLPIGIFLQKKNNISLREQQFAILIACTTAGFAFIFCFIAQPYGEVLGPFTVAFLSLSILASIICITVKDKFYIAVAGLVVTNILVTLLYAGIILSCRIVDCSNIHGIEEANTWFTILGSILMILQLYIFFNPLYEKFPREDIDERYLILNKFDINPSRFRIIYWTSNVISVISSIFFITLAELGARQCYVGVGGYYASFIIEFICIIPSHWIGLIWINNWGGGGDTEENREKAEFYTILCMIFFVCMFVTNSFWISFTMKLFEHCNVRYMWIASCILLGARWAVIFSSCATFLASRISPPEIDPDLKTSLVSAANPILYPKKKKRAVPEDHYTDEIDIDVTPSGDNSSKTTGNVNYGTRNRSSST